MSPLFRMACGCAGIIASALAAAQSYPSRPVRLVVPYPAGQGTDIAARHIAEQLSKALGQNFIVDNRPGAAGNVGAEFVAHASGDGYTLLMGASATHAMNPFMYASLAFDPEKDFEPIILTGRLPMVIAAHPGNTLTTIEALISAAKSKPDSINVALPSPTARIAFELLRQKAGAPLFGVAYKSSPNAITEVVGGQVPVIIDTVTAARPMVAAGKLRALGITTLRSSELMPGVKSVAEQGAPGFEVAAWNALYAPRATPPGVVVLLNAEVMKILAQSDTRQRLMQLGFEPAGGTPQQLAEFGRSEREKWGQVIRAANIRAE